MAGSSRRQQNRTLMLARSTHQRQRREAKRNRQKEGLEALASSILASEIVVPASQIAKEGNTAVASTFEKGSKHRGLTETTVLVDQVVDETGTWLDFNAASYEITFEDGKYIFAQPFVGHHVELLRAFGWLVGESNGNMIRLKLTDEGKLDLQFKQNGWFADWQRLRAIRQEKIAQSLGAEERIAQSYMETSRRSSIISSTTSSDDSMATIQAELSTSLGDASIRRRSPSASSQASTTVPVDKVVDETGAWLDFNGASYEIAFEDGKYIFVQPSVGHHVELLRAFGWLVGESNGNMIRLKLIDEGKLDLQFKQKGWFADWHRLKTIRQDKIAQSWGGRAKVGAWHVRNHC